MANTVYIDNFKELYSKVMEKEDLANSLIDDTDKYYDIVQKQAIEEGFPKDIDPMNLAFTIEVSSNVPPEDWAERFIESYEVTDQETFNAYKDDMDAMETLIASHPNDLTFEADIASDPSEFKSDIESGTLTVEAFTEKVLEAKDDSMFLQTLEARSDYKQLLLEMIIFNDSEFKQYADDMILGRDYEGKIDSSTYNAKAIAEELIDKARAAGDIDAYMGDQFYDDLDAAGWLKDYLDYIVHVDIQSLREQYGSEDEY